MKKAFIISMILGSFYGCSSQAIKTDETLVDIAERSQSTDSLLSLEGNEGRMPLEINNSNRTEAKKVDAGLNVDSQKI